MLLASFFVHRWWHFSWIFIIIRSSYIVAQMFGKALGFNRFNTFYFLCRDGQSRQIGFVGFRTAEQAEEAIKYFNRSFVGALKISVEVLL